MENKTINITMFQMDVAFGDVDANFNKIEKFLKANNLTYGTLLILPELFLTGYSKEAIASSAFSNNKSETISRLSGLAKQYKIRIYGSIAEEVGSGFCNTAVFISATGIEEYYRKSHLFGPMGEKDLFLSGSDIKTANSEGVVFGLSICYDLRFPTMYQEMMIQDANVILVVAEWPITRVNHWSALLQARAIENQAYVIGLNRVGEDPDYTYGGHSAIYSPYGDIVCEIANSEEGSASCKINLDLVEKFRNQFDVRNDRLLKSN